MNKSRQDAAANKKDKMEMDRPQTEKTTKQHDQASTVLEDQRKTTAWHTKANWRRPCEQKLITRNMTWKDDHQMAQDRGKWRNLLMTYASQRGHENRETKLD